MLVFHFIFFFAFVLFFRRDEYAMLKNVIIKRLVTRAISRGLINIIILLIALLNSSWKFQACNQLRWNIFRTKLAGYFFCKYGIAVNREQFHQSMNFIRLLLLLLLLLRRWSLGSTHGCEVNGAFEKSHLLILLQSIESGRIFVKFVELQRFVLSIDKIYIAGNIAGAVSLLFVVASRRKWEFCNGSNMIFFFCR